MDASYARGQLLYSRGRYAEAEAELRRSLTESPGNPYILALLALTIVAQDRKDEAVKMAQLAIGQSPDEPYPHYALALVYLRCKQLLKAKAAIDEALRLDPYDADYWHILGNIALVRSEFADALEAANHGLEIDAEHGDCQNLKATALTHLGRHDEANRTIKGQLQRDPDDAWTHANQGWACLHQNQNKQAMVHFREALRLDPELEFAQQGMLNALRARNPIYRLLLMYFLWMSRLGTGARWGVIIGGYMGFRLLNNLGNQYPALQVWTLPLVILYILFAFLTWTGPVIFNLFLRLDRYGRYLLSEDEVRASNIVGASLLLSLICGGLAFWLSSFKLVLAAVLFSLMVIPLAGTFNASRKQSRTLLALYTGALFVLGGAVIVLSSSDGVIPATPFYLFLIGFFCFNWLGVAISLRKPN